MTWTAAMIATLRDLWPDRELSATAIADRLAVTLAAVFGMAQRLGLPSRYPKRGSGNTRQKRRRTGVEPFLLCPAPEPLPAPPLPVTRQPCRCRWPLWPDFTRPTSPRFCDAPAAPGRAYCDDHVDLAIRRHGEPYRKLPPPTLLGRLLLAA